MVVEEFVEGGWRGCMGNEEGGEVLVGLIEEGDEEEGGEGWR